MNSEFNNERYGKLFMNKGNTIFSFDYNDLLETYNNHLVIAVNMLTESSNVDILYISDIIFGFNYFNSMVVCRQEKISIMEINQYINDRYKKLENRNISSFDEYTLVDKIFLKSCICLQEFERLGMKECFSPLVYQMFANCYTLEKLVSRSRAKRMN